MLEDTRKVPQQSNSQRPINRRSITTRAVYEAHNKAKEAIWKTMDKSTQRDERRIILVRQHKLRNEQENFQPRVHYKELTIRMENRI